MEILQGVWEVIVSIFTNSGYAYFFTADGGYKNAIMLLVAFVFLYLGIKKGFEPLLMVPIAFGMLLVNLTAMWSFQRECAQLTDRYVCQRGCVFARRTDRHLHMVKGAVDLQKKEERR